MANKQRGMEKRGEIRWGWTPPADSLVSVVKGKTRRECVDESDELILEQLEKDLLKVLADKVRENLS